jgi:phage-related protein
MAQLLAAGPGDGLSSSGSGGSPNSRLPPLAGRTGKRSWAEEEIALPLAKDGSGARLLTASMEKVPYLEQDMRPVFWIGSSLDDLKDFPDDVQHVMGYALELAQAGGKHPDAKPLAGDPAFRGAGVLEVIDNYQGDTYRAVYTVRYSDAVYALHCFQKKSTRGIATPQRDIELIKRRLKSAEEHWRRTRER